MTAAIVAGATVVAGPIDHASNRHEPGDLKSKIDDLMNGDVSSGKLTSDQATELQGVFRLLHRTSDRLSDLKTFRHDDARHSHPSPKREEWLPH